MRKLCHIEWTTPEYEDRMVLRLENNVIERAESHTVIRGEVYGCVRVTTHHSFGMNTRFETYKVGKDGVAKKATAMNDRPLHYELLHEGKTMILLGCNDTIGLRGSPCTMCQKKAA